MAYVSFIPPNVSVCEPFGVTVTDFDGRHGTATAVPTLMGSFAPGEAP
jgi:hypothetical protein